MAAFEDAIGSLLQDEGGYVNDPNDAGGETNYGISKRSFPNENIKALTPAKAALIYKSTYWAGKHLDQLKSQAVATKVLDLMVNMGPKTGARILQTSINQLVKNGPPLTEDGRIGPRTVAVANDADAVALLKAMQDNAARRYCAIVKSKPDNKRFLRGWLLRAYDRPRNKSEPTPECPAD